MRENLVAVNEIFEAGESGGASHPFEAFFYPVPAEKKFLAGEKFL